MATELHLDPELATVVERARKRAREQGEWPRKAIGTFRSEIPPEAADLIVEWLRDGGYDDAVAQIVAEDPDLATQ